MYMYMHVWIIVNTHVNNTCSYMCYIPLILLFFCPAIGTLSISSNYNVNE